MVIDNIIQAEHIMQDFALRTGLIGKAEPKRYLWTDAFAVCNFLGLYESQKDTRYLDLAKKLVDQVHHILGKERSDSGNSGWISGLDEKEGEAHPTIGGLRIGKELPERRPEEPFDEQLEWERDGQYFHYLTKWMYALSRMTELTGEYRYNRWAIELAKTAFAKFTYVEPNSGQRLMYWKMSIHLDRPLVSSVGQHDALDGWITYRKLQQISRTDPAGAIVPDLTEEIRALREMTAVTSLATADALGIGGLLSDTWLLTQQAQVDKAMLQKLLIASLQSLHAFTTHDKSLSYPADYRLAFRELGLAIGLEGVRKMDQRLSEPLRRFLPVGEEIIAFWNDEQNQQNNTWQEHENINAVMLATALAPDGYLGGKR